SQIDKDLAENQKFLLDILGEVPPVSFSYPFGARTIKTKRQLSLRFTTARGISPGINKRWTDLADLRANSIYAHSTTEHKIRTLIERAAAERGWFMFYTHDVSDSPTRWGTPPRLFEAAVKQAAASGCLVLPIRSALAAIGRHDTRSVVDRAGQNSSS